MERKVLLAFRGIVDSLFKGKDERIFTYEEGRQVWW